MFRPDRFVKWRTRSISPTSGSGGGAAARAAGGGSSAADGPGTSLAGSRWQRRPGWLSSKISSVARGLSIGSSCGKFGRGWCEVPGGQSRQQVRFMDTSFMAIAVVGALAVVLLAVIAFLLFRRGD